MKLNKKIMLALLAGNMLCMGSALAALPTWFGTSTGVGHFEDRTDALESNAKLILAGDELPGGDFTNKLFIGGYASVSGGSSDNNLVQIGGGTFNKGICCGESNSISGGGANNNTITITGGDFTGTEIDGGFSNHGDVTGNTILITGGDFSNDTYIEGGVCYYSGNANGNKIVITGGSFGLVEIIGGYGIYDGAIANDNIVEISGGTFANGGRIMGGMLEGIGNSTGNTLNLKIKMIGRLSDVGYFQEFNFTLPGDIQANDTMLRTDKFSVDIGGGSATINVTAANEVKLKSGDRITLIQVDTAMDKFVAGDILGGAGKLIYVVDGTEQETITDALTGVPLEIILEMLQDYTSGGNDKKVLGAKEKAPVEGIAAGVAMINQSADLASGEGLQNLLKNTGNFDDESLIYNIDTFGAITGTRTKYKTGSLWTWTAGDYW